MNSQILGAIAVLVVLAAAEGDTFVIVIAALVALAICHLALMALGAL